MTFGDPLQTLKFQSRENLGVLHEKLLTVQSKTKACKKPSASNSPSSLSNPNCGSRVSEYRSTNSRSMKILANSAAAAASTPKPADRQSSPGADSSGVGFYSTYGCKTPSTPRRSRLPTDNLAAYNSQPTLQSPSFTDGVMQHSSNDCFRRLPSEAIPSEYRPSGDLKASGPQLQLKRRRLLNSSTSEECSSSALHATPQSPPLKMRKNNSPSNGPAASGTAFSAAPTNVPGHRASTSMMPPGIAMPATSVQNGVVGLTNIGNSCYMNAGLVAVFSLPNFMRDLESKASIVANDSLYKAVVQLAGLKRKKKGVSMKQFLWLVKDKLSGHFKGIQQQDAHEFLNVLLVRLQEDWNNLGRCSTGMVKDVSDRVCPVADNFNSSICVTRTCSKCNHMSLSYETHTDFSLQFPKQDGRDQLHSIHGLLSEYLKSEQVERRCERCNHGFSRQQSSFSQLPRILMLHIQRADVDSAHNNRKRTDRLEIGSSLSLTGLCHPNAMAPPVVHRSHGDASSVASSALSDVKEDVSRHSVAASSVQNHNVAASSAQHHNVAASSAQHHNVAASSAQHHNVAASSAQHHNVAAFSAQHHNVAASSVQHHNVAAFSAQHHNVAASSAQHHNVAASSAQHHNVAAFSAQHHNVAASSAQHHNVAASSAQHHNVAAFSAQHHNVAASSAQHHNVAASSAQHHNVATSASELASAPGGGPPLVRGGAAGCPFDESHAHVQRTGASAPAACDGSAFSSATATPTCGVGGGLESAQVKRATSSCPESDVADPQADCARVLQSRQDMIDKMAEFHDPARTSAEELKEALNRSRQDMWSASSPSDNNSDETADPNIVLPSIDSDYRPVSVVSHLGEAIQSGHFIADVRAAQHGWLSYNDEAVTKISESDACRKWEREAYILLYLHRSVYDRFFASS
ncbi:ubiquitin carboxyl-terminal hydrolase 37-like isoform X2 [Sycon ciliatum]